MVEIVIPGKAQAKQRARTCRNGISYTPKETANYENLIKVLYLQKYHNLRLEGSLKMTIVVYIDIPKSKSKKQQEAMEKGDMKPISRPDVDNYAKSISDSLNGIAYKDDSQITTLNIHKKYSHEPRVEIKIEQD